MTCPTFRFSPIFAAILSMPSALWAAQINLAQYPAGTAYKPPIPNVIISVDTSGSMSFCDINGTIYSRCPANSTRIAFVKQGLQSTLINSSKYDNQFRLAWQSFACNGIPSADGNCNNLNAMGAFSGTHKANFSAWVANLSADGSTPTHSMMWNAGEYMKTTGADSPWNATPGVADNAPLTCRRAYNITLTDGGWNFSYDYIDDAFKAGMRLRSATDTSPFQNADGRDRNLPDGTQYLASSPQSQVYQDSLPNQVRYTTTGTRRRPIYTPYAYPSLADMAFLYWSTDLQPNISNEVAPKIKKTGSETFTSGNKSATLDEYWNPKNDPAKWQHLVQYSIGYGTTASNFAKNTPTSPQFTGGTFGMYDSGFSDLVTGKTAWDDVTSPTADDDYDDYRPQEMWHVAINSRGKFYPVAGGDLTRVFADIFDEIIVDTTAPINSFVSGSGSVSRVGTSSFYTTYVAADNPNSNDNRWYGFVSSDSISTDGTFTPNQTWGVSSNNKNVTTADKLDALTPNDLNNRLILSYDIASGNPNKAISFKWANLATSNAGVSAKMWLNKGTVGSASTVAGDGKGQDRLNFIRGDRTKEASNGGQATFRNRKSRQGDIVNSALWYVGAPNSGYSASSYRSFADRYRTRLPMLYVGGNDGMLHGFSAEDGAEKIAYIPHGVIQNIAALSDNADPAYSHQYYVDGSPLAGDINAGTDDTPNWRSYLVGTLAAGGRGYFILDITSPGPAKDTSVVPNTFVERMSNAENAPNLVVMDKTAAPINSANPPSKPADPNANADVGHIFGNPVVATSNQQRALQITRVNDGRWAFVTGNGYNSSNERPALLVQYLDGNKELKVIPAAAVGSAEAAGNGLSTPQFLDVNADGMPDFVYAGDLRGNLWKFDISSADANQWNVAFGGSPLFTASISNGNRQPITAPPVLRPNNVVGGLMVAFGTGQNLTENDRTDQSVQSIYSILDNTRYTIETTGSNKSKVKVATTDPQPTTVGGRSSLVLQSVDDGTKANGSGTSTGRSFWKLTNTEVAFACPSNAGSCVPKKGWYMDLPVAGERITTGFDFYDGSNLLEISSEVPASGSSTASGQEVCAPSPQAAQPFRTIINIVSGKAPTPPVMSINGSTYTAESANYARMTASGKELRIATKTDQIRKGSDGKIDKLARLPQMLARPNWRQLQ
ncbi:PilC/PilY family type IV pilus protein [Paracidovorax wautersii]|uniref:pilus assembly protein n=1 Tax=Paracidovorax wautersii TaxID=1177982 RepID=UPI0031E0A515